MNLLRSHTVFISSLVIWLTALAAHSLQAEAFPGKMSMPDQESIVVVNHVYSCEPGRTLDMDRADKWWYHLRNITGQTSLGCTGSTHFENGKTSASQQLYRRFSLNWNRFKSDNGMANVPTASASQSLLLNISSLSLDEFNSFLLQSLVSNKSSNCFSCTRQPLTPPFFKKFSLLPMVSCTAIGAP